jgi:uncharacterized membrane protein
VTNDYVPVFPWLGLVLAGLAIGRALLHRREALRLSRWRAVNRFARALAWAGRKSLPIYLIHQPVLFGVLYGVLQVTGPNPQAQARPFIAQCVADCTEANGNDAFCRTACSCVVQRLREDATFDRIMTGRPAPEDQRRISEAAQICLRGPPS